MRASFKKAVTVIATAGAITLGGSAVANAADRETVPDVAGLSVSEAVAAFEDAGFTDISVNVPSSTDSVIGTNFQAGTNVNENASILIIVPSR